MSKSYPNQPGFVLQPSAAQQGQYYQPTGYSQDGAHHRNIHHPNQPTPYPPQVAYQTQPFPAPIQHQPGFGGGNPQQNFNGWYSNSNFQDYLRNATSFHVKQKVELLEVLVGWETPNKYTVKDQSGHKVFYVGEESGCCPRQFCGSTRPFTLTVKNTLGNNVLIFDRPIDCSCCCGLFCPDSLTVSTPSGQKLGSVKQEFSLLYPRFELKDSLNKTVLKIEGPLCPVSLGCGPVVFRVTNLNGISVGTISKEWSGFVRELFTDADYFSMSFPIDLDLSMKAVCLGALFLIDFEYFETGPRSGTARTRFEDALFDD